MTEEEKKDIIASLEKARDFAYMFERFSKEDYINLNKVIDIIRNSAK